MTELNSTHDFDQTRPISLNPVIVGFNQIGSRAARSL
jgi:hypothetical protein